MEFQLAINRLVLHNHYIFFTNGKTAQDLLPVLRIFYKDYCQNDTKHICHILFARKGKNVIKHGSVQYVDRMSNVYYFALSIVLAASDYSICCKAHATINRKIGNSTPRKTVTGEVLYSISFTGGARVKK